MKKFLICTTYLSIFAMTAAALGHDKDPSCVKIQEACKLGGYKGKDIFRKCFMPVMKGDSVDNVLAEPADIAACKNAKKGKWDKKHENEKEGQKQEGSGD